MWVIGVTGGPRGGEVKWGQAGEGAFESCSDNHLLHHGQEEAGGLCASGEYVVPSAQGTFSVFPLPMPL